MKPRPCVTVALFANVMVVALAPVLLSFAPGLGSMIYDAYSSFCHQIEARSFSWAGHALPLCARCTGLWLGAFWFAALTRLRRLRPSAGILLVWFMVLDWSLARLGATPDFAIERFLTGVSGGLGAGILSTWLWRRCRASIRFGSSRLELSAARSSSPPS